MFFIKRQKYGTLGPLNNDGCYVNKISPWKVKSLHIYKVFAFSESEENRLDLVGSVLAY